MVESFYTYLHGPRTFWGSSSNRTVVNNNFFGIPMMSQCSLFGIPSFGIGCNNYQMPNYNCNSNMNNLFGLMLLNSMINGGQNKVLPNNGYTPYYNFSNTASQEGAGGTANNNSTGDNLATLQNYMTRLGFTAENGYSVAKTSDGTLQFTYNKDGKTVVASSLPELMSKISANTPTNSEKTDSLEDLVVAQSDETDEADKANEKVDDSDDDASAAAGDGKGEVKKTPAPKGGAKHFTMPNLEGQKIGGKELEWKHYRDTSGYVKSHVKNNMSVDDLVTAMLPRGTDLDKAKYKQWVIDANPNGIKNGKVADVNKLDLPVYKTAGSNSGHTKKTNYSNVVTPKKIAAQVEEEGKLNIKYNGTQNRIYKKNGSTSWDDDAIFVINGKNYTIKNSISNKKLDYYEITKQRNIGSSFKLINPHTGHFNPDKKIFERNGEDANGIPTSNKIHFVLEGDGNLNGARIELKHGKVVLVKGNKEELMDNIMLGKNI